MTNIASGNIYSRNISIHTLRVEGDVYRDGQYVPGSRISIHTLRVEGDAHMVAAHFSNGAFQSTPSAWRVTGDSVSTPRDKNISIHTLRVEGDCKSAQRISTLLFKVTDLRRNCRPDVHERTEGSSFTDRFYMVSFIFVVRRCPETTGHF